MPPDSNGNPVTAEEYVEQVLNQQTADQKIHALEVQAIVEQGRQEVGTDTFDQAAETIAQKLGPRTQEAMLVLRQLDNPVQQILDLAGNETELEKLAALPPVRLTKELIRREVKAKSYATVTSAEPLWKSGARGRISDADWNSSRQDALSEAAYTKEFNRRLAERYGRK